MKDIDVICLGRVAVDLYAEQYMCELSEADTFKKYVGGCAGNIAIGSARLGLRTSMLSCVGNDELGKYVINTLNEEGVDSSNVLLLNKHLTGLVLLGVNPPDKFPLMFYRENCADMFIMQEQLTSQYFSRSKNLLLTGTGLSTEHMRNITRQAIVQAKANNVKVILDIDYRPVLWGLTECGNGEQRYISSNDVSNHLQAILEDVDLLVGTEEEIKIAGGENNIEQSIDKIKQLTTATIVAKRGERGCTIFSGDNILNVASPKVKVLNVLGAGDAFMSGFLYGWLNNKSLEQSAQYGCLCGAIVVTRHACSASMPFKEELEFSYTQYIKNKTLMKGQDVRHVQENKTINSALNILAFDHRSQFEQSLIQYYGENQPKIIIDFKNILFNVVRKTHKDIDCRYSDSELGVIVDPVYGEEILSGFADSEIKNDINLWVPIEQAGEPSLQWINSDLSVYGQLLHRPRRWSVKVLFKFNIDWSEQVRSDELFKLRELYLACKQQKKQLLLEVILPKQQKTDVSVLMHTMLAIYDSGIFPELWKIYPLLTQADWGQLDDCIKQRDENARVIILGGDNNFESVVRMMKIAGASPVVVGYAVGRAVFWDIWLQFFSNDITKQEAAKELYNRYSRLITLWQSCKVSIQGETEYEVN